MKSYKYLLKNFMVINALSFIAFCYIKFVYMTTSWQKIGFSYPDKYWQNNKPFICVFWHNRLMMSAFGWDNKRQLKMLISSHSDGKIISKVISYFKINTIFGSTNKGAIFALKAMIMELKKGHSVGITPDGPKGPRLNITDGVIKLSQLSGCDIIPLTYATSNRKIVKKAWDKFVVPFPFAKGVLLWGKPMHVKRNYHQKSYSAQNKNYKKKC